MELAIYIKYIYKRIQNSCMDIVKGFNFIGYWRICL